MLSSETSCHQGLRIAFPPREFLGALGNIWGIPWHECLLLCSWRMAQITKQRVGLYSYEIIPEGRAHTLHFNPHFLTMYTHTAHVAFSLNFSFHALSSYSFSYSVVLHICECLCSSVSFKCPLHSPPPFSSLSPFICLSYSLSCKCWFWPVTCCSVGIHACAEQQIWLPADKVVACVPSFSVCLPRGKPGILE